MKVIIGSGFIGSALSKKLPDAGHIITSSKGLNLDKDADWLELEGVDTVYLCAGRTGGVGRMSKDPLSFIYPNVRIHMNVFEACVKARVRRVVCVGSTTGYPNTPEAVKESQYLEGDLHPAYEVPGNAHRFIKRLANMLPLEVVFFRPSNVYGPGNSFDPQFSHVIEATVRKVVEKHDPFIIWGTGKEVRDAIYIDDLTSAMADHGSSCEPGDYNVGSGQEMDVNTIAHVLMDYKEFHPRIQHDLSMPTAIPARRVDCSKLKSLGWRPKVSMEEGLKKTLDWFESHRLAG